MNVNLQQSDKPKPSASVASSSSFSAGSAHFFDETMDGSGFRPTPSEAENQARPGLTDQPAPTPSKTAQNDNTTTTTSQSAGADTTSQFSFTAWQSPSVTASSYMTSAGLSGLGQSNETLINTLYNLI